MPETQITIIKAANSIFFKENAWYSTWHSLNEEVGAGDFKPNPRGNTDKTYNELVEDAKRVMLEPDNVVSYRFEITYGSVAKRWAMRMRLLPAMKSKLHGHSAFDAMDVSTVGGATILLEHRIFTEGLVDLNDVYPVAPLIFSTVRVEEEDYRAMLAEGFKAVLKPVRIHDDIPLDKIKAYLKKPSGGPHMNTGLLDKKVPRTRGDVKKKKDQNPEFLGASGTCQLVKFGTGKPLREFIVNRNLTDMEIRFLCLHLASGTWDSYITHWKCYFNFCGERGISRELPTSVDTIVDYLCYLRCDKNLEYQSIKCYKSGLRKLHEINAECSQNLDDPRVNNVMQGIHNDCLVNSKVKYHRCVVTWEIMILLGHEIAKSDMSPWDKQVIWTLFLFAYFGSRRMGELISTTKKKFDPMTTVTWDKVKNLNEEVIVLIILLPKVSEDPAGIVVDYKSWPEKSNYCPVLNFKYLAHLRVERGDVDFFEPVFRLSNGDLITQDFVNNLLEKFLRKHFSLTIGRWTCHSFRAGVPSDMASNPVVFNETETKLMGLWKTDTVKRYTRLNGEARVKGQEKFQQFLRYFDIIL